MTGLRDRLDQLGLSAYFEELVAEGFDTWETILDITESDLNALGFKLGHRRKLQRAIAETRPHYPDRVLPLKYGGGGDGGYRSDDSSEMRSVKRGEASSNAAATSTKRKYRRHPKADEHAPERPPSAYVIFSNQMREELKGQELTFTEIAKVVGERWQVLSPDAREGYEREANTAKEKYYAELAEYKKTPQYAEYQEYLKEFKAKHATTQSEGKRSKLETETSNGSTSNNQTADSMHRTRTTTNNHTDAVATNHRRSGSSPPHTYNRQAPPPHISNTTSPGSYFPPIHQVPEYSPISSTPSHMKDTQRGTPASQSFPSTSSGTPPSTGLSHRELPRRSFRDSPSLPPLTHEETTLSSDGGSIVSMPSHVENATNSATCVNTSAYRRAVPVDSDAASKFATRSFIDRSLVTSR
ncbi:hypothetical protein EJ05DRAFT_527525 [Pseudovirgaria hyperparasitica]|uniref:HMG box domain-containing protein n=1 Tax=Pseudovirgaria hyperparasitica TaxID=470096 RepID=A0A6A6W9H4_9PEZI|nr:uncharacterized protein EJ05DRAFT_527525 [Pseudovirgaria hyperparasitica]KAF2759323.1 hypothetical protein EJ05DRAFT_527525 [Pseudovirgaria hyperparasitica]